MKKEILKIDLRKVQYFEEHKTQALDWISRQDDLVLENKKFDLKKGDIISFMAGYNRDIEYTTEVLAFGKSEAKDYAIVVWDCYWFGVNLKERNYVKTI